MVVGYLDKKVGVVFLLFSCMLLLSGTMFAKKAVHASDSKAWLGEIHRESALPVVGFPHRIAFLNEVPKKNGAIPSFLEFDVAGFNALGFFQAADTRSAVWDYKLNPQLKTKDPFIVLAQLLKVDTFILAPASGPWRFVRIVNGKKTVLKKAPAPADLQPATIYDWIPATLGWDGVVIAVKDEELLVAASPKLLAAPDLQALAVKDSAGQFSLAKNRKGTGLLSLSQFAEGVGVFDVVILEQGVKKIEVGTKLIIQRKSNPSK